MAAALPGRERLGPLLAKIFSAALVGTEGCLVEVEVNSTSGVPGFTVVGLAARSITEAEQRIRSALATASQEWPRVKLIANLAPAALRKEGTHFDLPLALGVLTARERIDGDWLQSALVMGELALDGRVRPVRGVLAAAMEARRAGLDRVVCPKANACEAALVEGLEIVGVSSLSECLAVVRGETEPPPVERPPAQEPPPRPELQEVRGQRSGKWAVEIAAAGGHNLLLSGPPGSGKTMLASRLPGLLPEMSQPEALEVTRIYSVAGLLPEGAGLITARPFRAPHHHISAAGLVGGGSGMARPGEVSLAHRGVLFLDELPLFPSAVLNTLRAPLEGGRIRIARSAASVLYPCRFTLVGAMNPCPCGYQGDARRACRCSDHQREVYQGRVSGPLLDRFDLQVSVRRVSKSRLLGPPEGPTTAEVARRVAAAREIQAERYGEGVTNACAPHKTVEKCLNLDSKARSFAGWAIDHVGLSGMGLDRLFRVARTVADLEGGGPVTEEHLRQALGLRIGVGGEEAA